MATITLEYDAKNTLAKKTVDYILSLGVFYVDKKKMMPFEQAIEDVKNGRVTRIKNPANFINECLE